MLRLLGRVSCNRQSVYVALHQIAERLVNQTVARELRLAGESLRNDGELIMAAAARGAGMTGVRGAIVDDVYAVRLQADEPLPHKSDGVVQGKALR